MLDAIDTLSQGDLALCVGRDKPTVHQSDFLFKQLARCFLESQAADQRLISCFIEVALGRKQKLLLIKNLYVGTYPGAKPLLHRI